MAHHRNKAFLTSPNRTRFGIHQKNNALHNFSCVQFFRGLVTYTLRVERQSADRMTWNDCIYNCDTRLWATFDWKTVCAYRCFCARLLTEGKTQSQSRIRSLPRCSKPKDEEEYWNQKSKMADLNWQSQLQVDLQFVILISFVRFMRK